MARANGHPAKPQPSQQHADRPLGQDDAEFGFDRSGEVDAPPTDETMTARSGPNRTCSASQASCVGDSRRFGPLSPCRSIKPDNPSAL